ncbi:hypothetical protein GCM10009549_26070 [Streptomyces thermoalcalitolerans]|uniref:Thiazolylpeptide-type bacteriocin n=1 Tax=Streptomyces thermoalcalitolerans TaxID=65605 RepID=A0ABN1NNT4_9ACTN
MSGGRCNGPVPHTAEAVKGPSATTVRPDSPGGIMNKDLSTLADEILELEAETFEISDYSDASEVVLAGCTSTSSTSTSSSTCSTTSCSA